MADTRFDQGAAREFPDGAAILAAQGLPVRDDYGHTPSPLRFGDGGSFRIEISGVERLSTLEAMLDEADRRGVFIHRVVAFGGGATLLDQSELRAFAELAHERGIEVVACPGPRSGWDRGRQAVSPEGMVTGHRLRGIDNVRYLLDDCQRIFEAGLRGLLVLDEGALDVLAKARANGDVPADAFFKVSVYTGHGNPAAIRLVESLGADSLNPVGDLSCAMLAAIRSQITIPLDIWAITFDSFGGMNRLWEAGAIAEVAAPVYFKVEPGESEASMYNAWHEPGFHQRLVRHKVRHSEILLELAARTHPSVAPSPAPELSGV